VEAGAPHWIKQELVAATSLTTLQFLPQGTQSAILSTPQDYGPSSPAAPQWLLVTMPFLGRLQDQADDQPSADVPFADLSALQMDPIAYLHQQFLETPSKPFSDLALALTHWSDRRVVDGLVAYYRFEQGTDPKVVYDVSGVDAPLNLTIQNVANVDRPADGGLAVRGATRLISTGSAGKISGAIMGQDELTIEAWIAPANTSQGEPACIVSISKSQTAAQRDPGAGSKWRPTVQHLWRTPAHHSDDPERHTWSSDALGWVTAALTHVAYTRDRTGKAVIYVNGRRQAGPQAALCRTGTGL